MNSTVNHARPRIAIIGGGFAGLSAARALKDAPAEVILKLGDSLYSGFTAWLLWLSVHLVKLVGFRNRTFVLLDWMFAYLRSERSGRVVLGRQRPKRPADCPSCAEETSCGCVTLSESVAQGGHC
jgi:hypothetical protein